MWAFLLLALAQEDPKVRQELDYANDAQRPVYQGQAIERLKARGDAAVAPILQWVEKNGRRKMAIVFVEFLGGLRDERISKLLDDCIRDRAFEWRPAATQALATHARAGDRDLFRNLLADPLWGVRLGAIHGIERLKDREAAPELRKRLNDESYEVRSRAAKALHAFGDDSGLPVLVESLSIESTWFEIDHGVVAREDAWAFLKGIARDDFGYQPWESREKRAPGLAKWNAWMEARDPEWRAKVPERAKAAAPAGGWVFGFELRSCQLGELFLRLDTKGRLVLGWTHLQERQLSSDERAKLDRAIAKIREIDRSAPWGRGGCDFEQYWLLNDAPGYDKLWIGREGRPPEGDLFVATVAELLKTHFGEAVASDFREKTDLFRAPD
jgi:hypothetical protein